ncbi:hypothetical protein D9M72_452000 [compost metagenome]
MSNEADVRLVDPHAEGNGGHHHQPFFLAKARLVALARAGVHAGVIRQRIDALPLQPCSGVLHLLARQAVDDAAVMRAVGCGVLRLDESQQLLASVVLLDDAVADIGPVEAGDENAGVVQRQPLDDLVARQRVCGCSQRDARHVRETFVQHRQLDVLRPEIMAPLRYAMRLVDGEQSDAGTLEQVEEARRHQPLGRNVEDLHPAGEQVALDGGCFRTGQR